MTEDMPVVLVLVGLGLLALGLVGGGLAAGWFGARGQVADERARAERAEYNRRRAVAMQTWIYETAAPWLPPQTRTEVERALQPQGRHRSPQDEGRRC